MKRGYSFKCNLVLVLFLLFLILFLIIFFYKINSNENIDSTSKLWISYDLSVSQLKNNLDIVMDYSADDLTCGNLKGISFEDGSY